MTDQAKVQQQASPHPLSDAPDDRTKDTSVDAPLADNSSNHLQEIDTAADSPTAELSKEDASSKETPPKAPEDEFTWGQGLELDVTHDRMTARLTVVIDYAEHYTPKNIQRYLSENRITYGVNEENLRQIFENSLFNQKVIVAEGQRTQHGDDGYVDWKVDLSILDGAALVERGGRVDWKERHFVLEVDEGDLLATLVDPTSGEPGITVHGEEIDPKPGKESRLPAGKNVTISGDGKSMIAAIKGVVCREGERISISPTYVIQGDVNFATGNVEFDESVIISGGVLTDFKVKAGQDLHINGLVEGADLTSGGSTYISAGVQGCDKAVIKSGENITVKFVNGATLIAEGDIIVNGPVTHSSLRAGGSIRLLGDKGIAMGGVFSAEKEINAQIIGSEGEVKTHLEVGKNFSNILSQRREEEKKLQSLHENYKKLRSAVKAMDQVKEKGGKLTEQQEALRLKIIRTGLQVQAQIKKVQETITCLNNQYAETRRDIRGVVARGLAWPGAHIDILNHTHIVKSQTSKCQFMLSPKNKIETYAYVEQGKDKNSRV